MFTNQDIVAIIFRIINFILLIGIGSFIFKRHVMPDLLNSIAEKKNNEDSLITQQSSLEKQQLTLDLLLKEEALMCEDFRLKIDEWKKVVNIEADADEKKRAHDLMKYNARIHNIALQREHMRVQKIVAHELVMNLQKSLSLHFKDKEQGTEYLNTILHFMDEKII